MGLSLIVAVSRHSHPPPNQNQQSIPPQVELKSTSFVVEKKIIVGRKIIYISEEIRKELPETNLYTSLSIVSNRQIEREVVCETNRVESSLELTTWRTWLASNLY